MMKLKPWMKLELKLLQTSPFREFLQERKSEDEGVCILRHSRSYPHWITKSLTMCCKCLFFQNIYFLRLYTLFIPLWLYQNHQIFSMSFLIHMKNEKRKKQQTNHCLTHKLIYVQKKKLANKCVRKLILCNMKFHLFLSYLLSKCGLPLCCSNFYYMIVLYHS